MEDKNTINMGGGRNELTYDSSLKKFIFNKPRFFISGAIAGDILLTNAEGTEKYYVTPKHYRILKEQGKIGENGYTPIGVCAIPASLTLKGEGGVNRGKSRVVSLAYMSLKTPDSGNLNTIFTDGDNRMVWGDNATVFTDYVGRNNPCYSIDLRDNKLGPKNVRNASFASTETSKILNGQSSIQDVNVSDPKLPRYESSNVIENLSSDRSVCSPYDSTGGYFYGYLGKLDGEELNETILKSTTVDWKTGEIENNSSSKAGYFPPIFASKRYYTKGTQAGDWYLPTIGELGIMWARMKEINNSFQLIGPKYSIPVLSFIYGKNQLISPNAGRELHSVTEFDQHLNYCLDSYRGLGYTQFKKNNQSARAFLAV